MYVSHTIISSFLLFFQLLSSLIKKFCFFIIIFLKCGCGYNIYELFINLEKKKERKRKREKEREKERRSERKKKEKERKKREESRRKHVGEIKEKRKVQKLGISVGGLLQRLILRDIHRIPAFSTLVLTHSTSWRAIDVLGNFSESVVSGDPKKILGIFRQRE